MLTLNEDRGSMVKAFDIIWKGVGLSIEYHGNFCNY